nr:RING-H2 finger protein ATL70-like [Tanacetum cinerariifolium]
MVSYEAFACRCGAGDVVLRESYKPKTRERTRFVVGCVLVNSLEWDQKCGGRSGSRFMVEEMTQEGRVRRLGIGNSSLPSQHQENDKGEPSYDTEETQRGSSYIYSLSVFSGVFLLIILFYISYICKRRARFQSPPPTTISLATNTNDTNNNHHFIRLSRGLDDDFFMTFPTYVYSEVIVSSMEDVSTNTNSYECTICLSDYKPSDVIRVRGGSLGGVHGSRRKVNKMIVKMMKMVRMKTIYFRGSGLMK